MLVRLLLPKYVSIDNWRLRFLYNVLFLNFGLFVIGICVYNKSYSKKMSLDKYMRTSFTAGAKFNPGVFQQAFGKVISDPNHFCHRTRSYDYSKASDPLHSWTNLTCATTCLPSETNEGCFMPPELIQREANGIFYATHIEIMNLESSEDVSMNNSIQYASKNYLLPFEDVYDINFQYSFEMETQDVSSLNNLGLAGGFRGDSATVPTVLLDSRGNSVRTVEPSQTGIHLSVKELLEIAEKDNWLDEMQPTLGADLQRGTAGPYGRISGVELDLRLRCFSPGARPTFLGVDTMIQGPLCSLQVHGAQPNWVTREYVDTLHGKFRYTRAHGIQVKIEAEGEVRHFDLPMLFLFIVEAIVLMQVPACVWARRSLRHGHVILCLLWSDR